MQDFVMGSLDNIYHVYPGCAAVKTSNLKIFTNFKFYIILCAKPFIKRLLTK
jgi:hypothetical protein